MKGKGMPSGNAHMYRQLNGRRLLTGMVLAILTLGLIVVDLGMGSSGIGPGEVVDALLGGPDGDTANTAILWSIRLPMTLTCVFVGGSLSLAGLQIQTITNNALASPYTLGITASASFGAAIAITLGLSVAGYLWIGTALLALVFALAVSLLIFYVGRLKGMSTSTLILSGIFMNFFFQALQQYLQYRASPEIAQIISGWTFGNLQRSSWMSVVVSGCLLVMGAALLSGWSWRLTVLTTGEERARSLGINVERLRLHVFLICSFLIADARRDNSPPGGVITPSKSLLHSCQQNYKNEGRGNFPPPCFYVLRRCLVNAGSQVAACSSCGLASGFSPLVSRATA